MVGVSPSGLDHCGGHHGVLKGGQTADSAESFSAGIDNIKTTASRNYDDSICMIFGIINFKLYTKRPPRSLRKLEGCSRELKMALCDIYFCAVSITTNKMIDTKKTINNVFRKII